MQNNELRKMRRTELIEIIYAMQQNEKKITEECEELRKKLADKNIRIEESGSIAEAALALNHVFEDAEKAVEQYLLSAKNKEEQADRIIEEAETKAAEIIASAEKLATEMVENANRMAAEVASVFVKHSEILNESMKKGRLEHDGQERGIAEGSGDVEDSQ